jgi:hypothetical protein
MAHRKGPGGRRRNQTTSSPGSTPTTPSEHEPPDAANATWRGSSNPTVKKERATNRERATRKSPFDRLTHEERIFQDIKRAEADVERMLQEAEDERRLLYASIDEMELPPTTPDLPPDTRLTDMETDELRGVLSEIVRRSREALRLYTPMPEQARFHASHAPERIIRGGNRGGKTLASAAEVARALTGQDPFGKYPTDAGRAIAVGKDLLHCSKVMYRKLFKPGAFQVIIDTETGELRAFDPILDAGREHLAKPAPPLIPRRFYSAKDISWENKREEIPKTVRLKTGWEITFFSSLGAPPQGWDVDFIWFDEEIEHPAWYPEMSARLVDRRRIDATTGKQIGGKFIWGATPQVGTQQLYDLSQAAAECAADANPAIEEFFVSLLNNSRLSEESKQVFIKQVATNEDEYRIRVLGEFALVGMRIYPEFSPKGAHRVPLMVPIPDDWCVVASVDPGRQVCGVLFAALPPPSHEWAGRVIVFDELYIKRCSAMLFAEKFKGKMGDREVYACWIDHHAGRITEMGSGRTIEEQYREALVAAGVKFSRPGFVWGDDDVKAGIEAVRKAMHVDGDGRSRFGFMWEKLPNLMWEAERYVYKKGTRGQVVTDEPLKHNDHLMDAWRYLAIANLRYMKPRPRKRKEVGAAAYIKSKKKKAANQSPVGGSIQLY